MNLIAVIFSFLTLINSTEKTTMEIPSIFSDNMVLQQNSTASFWGKAEPRIKVNINASWGESATTNVNDDGSWLAKIKTPSAGGPFEVNLTVGDSTIIYKNILIGEVWLCSGQSNMEMPLQGWPPNDLILNSQEEIKNSSNSNIRLFSVSRAYSVEKEFNVDGKWEECNPQTIASFSATAYFFGKRLQEKLNIPIGLIHSSWGGTPAESWTSNEYLESIDDFKPILADIENSKGDIQKYKVWLSDHPVINIDKPLETSWENLDFNDEKCSSTNFKDSMWREVDLPRLWETSEVGNFDGVIWFRKKIEIPESWRDQNLVIELGPIDDMDRTYVNGVLIGAHEKSGFWRNDRIYNIPKELLSKEILIAVRVLDNQGGGGLYGDIEKLKIHPTNSDESISLSGKWKYLPVAEYHGQKFYAFDIDKMDYYSRPLIKISLSANTPTTLFNAMINPLVPYSIGGAIWYQGESNTGRSEQYTTLFPLMIKNWREVWGLGDFPFYYVQIAPYNYGSETHSEFLRESQLKSLSVQNTGMVVTLDIGNPVNIHPSNKQDVGKRLADWALAKTYNKNVPYSGPLYKSMKVEKDKIVISFDHCDELVVKQSEDNNNFLIAGTDSVFKNAEVKIDNDQLILFNPEIENPVAARYAWSNTAAATLFNKEGLPASSFRTDNWEE